MAKSITRASAIPAPSGRGDLNFASQASKFPAPSGRGDLNYRTLPEPEVQVRRIASSSRARGSNRGGCGGGGYEQTNPDYNQDKLKRLKSEYEVMDPRWRRMFLEGLSPYEQAYVTGKIRSTTPP